MGEKLKPFEDVSCGFGRGFVSVPHWDRTQDVSPVQPKTVTHLLVLLQATLHLRANTSQGEKNILYASKEVQPIT